MKVLVTGYFDLDFYEPAFCRGLREAGADVIEVPVRKVFGPVDLIRRAQEKYVRGPAILRANSLLVESARRTYPDVVLAWRTPWLRSRTIASIQETGALVALYNHDDPFGPDRDMSIWKAFRRSIPAADICLTPRRANLDEYMAEGARRVGILDRAYDPGLHRPVELTAADRHRFGAEVAFPGHYEDDGRVTTIASLVDAGVDVRVYGPGWAEVLGPMAERVARPIVYGEEYVRAIAAAKIALVILSTRNRDEHTTRCFEIPAIGRMMMAPRTSELQGLFIEDKEAVFYSSDDELVELTKLYLENDQKREEIAHAGRERVRRDGHDWMSRARGFLRQMAELK